MVSVENKLKRLNYYLPQTFITSKYCNQQRLFVVKILKPGSCETCVISLFNCIVFGIVQCNI
ncbi:hypothetical protein KUTeg_013507 [Tegillarca granosa]|uniref:Uncharacterized protein n=1 Tax=Tegillarca granosa TaxID=220873 RepID=A0ABQ9ETW4_TEGGR|nr:hypothetical protein KUTeg_013507 [Tegillarca granosa]